MFSRFGGGIHPPEHKNITELQKFINLPVPHTCYIPLLQHSGVPARLIVGRGDLVSEGQCIGRADGPRSANVHSSIPGKVVDIAGIPTPLGEQTSVIIEAEGSFSASTGRQQADEWASLSPGEILKRIEEAGVVGLGGDAVPTRLKLSAGPGIKIDTLIVNAAESEPYLTAEDMIMKSFPGFIIEGIRITLKALGATRAQIGIGSNKKEAAAALRKALDEAGQSEIISIKTVRAIYPQGEEKLMASTLLRKRLPAGTPLEDIGAVMLNVGTVAAVRDAVIYNRSLFARYMTVSGDSIARPGNYKVRIGTRIRDIVDECGGFKSEPAAVIMGGPMRGLAVSSLDVPVVKGTAGLLFLSHGEMYPKEHRACIRCGKCVAVCPMGLLPNELGAAVEKKRFDRARVLNPADCMQCGCCTYVCPSRRPLNGFIKIARDTTMGDGNDRR